MSDTTPYAGLSPERLTALINQDNNSRLRLGVDFTFGIPGPYSDTFGRNTQVSLTPAPGTPYPAPETAKYTRLPLTVLDALPEGWVQPVAIDTLPFKLSMLLDQINQALGLNLTSGEIVDVTYDSLQLTYRLPINEGVSLGWVDSEFEFEAQFPGGGIPLDRVVRNTTLNGLTWIQQ